MVAGLPMTCVLDGDDSLRRRPVARIIEPLRSMGATLHGRRDDSLPPLTVVGHTPLRAADITTPVPSAQVKSAILLAGLQARGRTTVREAVVTRDHTERMLRARGVEVERTEGPDGGVAWTVEGGVSVQAITEHVPGDRPRRPSGSWPARSIPTRSSRSVMSGSTRRGARSSTCCGRWAPTSKST